MRTIILASIGCQNLGDELILKNQIENLKKENPNREFTVFTYDKENIFYEKPYIKYKEYFPIGAKNPKNILKNIKNFFTFLKEIYKSDEVIFGGGGIFYSNEVQATKSPMLMWFYRAILIKMLGKKLHIHSVSINIKNKEDEKMIKTIFALAKTISLRDEESKNYVENLGFKGKIIKDPVFSDTLNQNGKILGKTDINNFKITDLENIDFSNKRIGLAFRSGYLKNEEEKIKEIISFITKKGGQIIMLPHSFHKLDEKANDYTFLKNFKTQITENMLETYNVYKYKKVDLVISMRLHSMILSHIYGVDQFAISYSQKTSSIIKTLD